MNTYDFEEINNFISLQQYSMNMNTMNDHQLHMLTPSNENEYTNIMNIENIDQNIDENNQQIEQNIEQEIKKKEISKEEQQEIKEQLRNIQLHKLIKIINEETEYTIILHEDENDEDDDENNENDNNDENTLTKHIHPRYIEHKQSDFGSNGKIEHYGKLDIQIVFNSEQRYQYYLNKKNE